MPKKRYRLTKRAEDFLRRIPAKHRKQILEKIELLSVDPSAIPTVQLEGFPQFRRAKSGEYRIIYMEENGEYVIAVIRIGKRNDGEVYKNLNVLT